MLSPNGKDFKQQAFQVIHSKSQDEEALILLISVSATAKLNKTYTALPISISPTVPAKPQTRHWLLIQRPNQFCQYKWCRIWWNPKTLQIISTIPHGIFTANSFTVFGVSKRKVGKVLFFFKKLQHLNLSYLYFLSLVYVFVYLYYFNAQKYEPTC